MAIEYPENMIGVGVMRHSGPYEMGDGGLLLTDGENLAQRSGKMIVDIVNKMGLSNVILCDSELERSRRTIKLVCEVMRDSGLSTIQLGCRVLQLPKNGFTIAADTVRYLLSEIITPYATENFHNQEYLFLAGSHSPLRKAGCYILPRRPNTSRGFPDNYASGTICNLRNGSGYDFYPSLISGEEVTEELTYQLHDPYDEQ